MFMLSFLEILKGVRKSLHYYRSKFFWQSDENKRKYRLSNGILFVDLKIREAFELMCLS
jgi:hypothetical protein